MIKLVGNESHRQ